MAFEAVRTRTEIDTLHELLEDLDYYRLLLVPRTAGVHEIETAFRAQTKALHPDRFFALDEADVKLKAQEIFRRVNEAWRTLKDPTLREAYDRELRVQGGRAHVDGPARAGGTREASVPGRRRSRAHAERRSATGRSRSRTWPRRT